MAALARQRPEEDARAMGIDDQTGLGMAFGTAEEGMSWIGRRDQRGAEVAVNEAMIRNFCALVEDAHPDYWTGGIAPPGMVMCWMMPLPWRPGTGQRRNGLFALDVPLPGHHIINVSTDTELLDRSRVGDHVECSEEITDVSSCKHTRLGDGHFITTTSTFSSAGKTFAINENLLFRYDTPGQPAPEPVIPGSELEALLADPPERATGARPWSTSVPSPRVGDELPALSLDVSYQRVVLNAAATWDWFPGHHNPFYARSQGQRTIYLSTLFFHGIVDRLVTDWAGPGAFVTRRKISMRQSIFAGERATARGTVVSLQPDPRGTLVGVEASVDGPHGPCVPAEVTVRLAPIGHSDR